MTVIKSIEEVRKNGFLVNFYCDYCKNESTEKKSHYDRKVRHYCNTKCYSSARKELWSKSDQPTWRGGVSPYEAHRRYVKKNPERIAHLKARRYARERGADGKHTLDEWVKLKESFNNVCAYCGSDEKMTKDHIIPLSKGGSDFISNIQPLCKSCNSKKHNHVHQNPELLEQK